MNQSAVKSFISEKKEDWNQWACHITNLCSMCEGLYSVVYANRKVALVRIDQMQKIWIVWRRTRLNVYVSSRWAREEASVCANELKPEYWSESIRFRNANGVLCHRHRFSLHRLADDCYLFGWLTVCITIFSSLSLSHSHTPFLYVCGYLLIRISRI